MRKILFVLAISAFLLLMGCSDQSVIESPAPIPTSIVEVSTEMNPKEDAETSTDCKPDQSKKPVVEKPTVAEKEVTQDVLSEPVMKSEEKAEMQKQIVIIASQAEEHSKEVAMPTDTNTDTAESYAVYEIPDVSTQNISVDAPETENFVTKQTDNIPELIPDVPAETVSAKTTGETINSETDTYITQDQLREVMDHANTYAAGVYGMTVDLTLNEENSAYRCPAQAYYKWDPAKIESKAFDMVDYTFTQMMEFYDVPWDEFIECGLSCNVHCEIEGESVLIYVFYE